MQTVERKTYKLTSGKWGGASKHNKGNMTWNTPQDFLNSDYNDTNNEENNGYGYHEGYLIPTNSEQDNIVKETFIQAVNQGYSLIKNHCSIAVQKSLNAIGLKTHVKFNPLIINASPTFPANVTATTFVGALSGNAATATTATNVAWSGVTSKPSYYDAKAIKGITRSGTTFTYTCMDGTTGTFTQQDNNTTYSVVTTSANGLMSATDKSKLDTMELATLAEVQTYLGI